MPAAPDNSRRDAQMVLMGARWVLVKLGVGTESLLYRFVMQELQEFIADRSAVPTRRRACEED